MCHLDLVTQIQFQSLCLEHPHPSLMFLYVFFSAHLSRLQFNQRLSLWDLDLMICYASLPLSIPYDQASVDGVGVFYLASPLTEVAQTWWFWRPMVANTWSVRNMTAIPVKVGQSKFFIFGILNFLLIKLRIV